MSRLAGFRRPRWLEENWLGDRELWRRNLWRWLPALVALALALVFFLVYLSRFAGRVEVSAQTLDRSRQELTRLRAERERIEREVATVHDNGLRLTRFYDQQLSTERRRLTKIIAEVKELAERSGLVPEAISYPDETIEDFGLRKRSFVFGVEGTYADLRKLINLIELSDSFLTLERVSLSGAGDHGNRLRIQLALSTLFATAEPEGGPSSDTDAAPGSNGSNDSDASNASDGAEAGDAAEPAAEPVAEAGR